MSATTEQVAHSPLPWRVARSEATHRKGSNACQERCGGGTTPIRIEHDHDARWAESEIHVMGTGHVDDITDAVDGHVVCFGHDYDDYGYVALTDAEFIVRACNNFDAVLDALRAFCGDHEETHFECAGLNAAYLHAMSVIAKADGR